MDSGLCSSKSGFVNGSGSYQLRCWSQGCTVGLAVARADTIPGVDKLGGGLPVRASSAEALLGIIAASMLTFVGVVFTITLVALQLASAQLSPRVIRTFVRSGVTKLAFGLFLATFGRRRSAC